jgi:hypothetical protein
MLKNQQHLCHNDNSSRPYLVPPSLGPKGLQKYQT